MDGFQNLIYFTYPLGKEPTENVWKGRASFKKSLEGDSTNLLSMPVEAGSNSSYFSIRARGETLQSQLRLKQNIYFL